MFTCRKTGCENEAHFYDNHWTFYCMNHMRCGAPLNGKSPCQGCLNTDRNSNAHMQDLYQMGNQSNKNITNKPKGSANNIQISI